ncbi:unnamed protein product [Paramecium sonneborni]|uniref:Uncharacterized protein n=1 Tax=Paramecium sonneborni TaxID=65129 RepID=A0A8S1K5M4_9CILI|nr:unnamed protein product [Paramecium sonneborni]
MQQVIKKPSEIQYFGNRIINFNEVFYINYFSTKGEMEGKLCCFRRTQKFLIGIQCNCNRILLNLVSITHNKIISKVFFSNFRQQQKSLAIREYKIFISDCFMIKNCRIIFKLRIQRVCQNELEISSQMIQLYINTGKQKQNKILYF